MIGDLTFGLALDVAARFAQLVITLACLCGAFLLTVYVGLFLIASHGTLPSLTNITATFGDMYTRVKTDWIHEIANQPWWYGPTEVHWINVLWPDIGDDDTRGGF